MKKILLTLIVSAAIAQLSAQTDGRQNANNQDTGLELKVFPNPSTGNVTIETQENSTLELYSISGQLVKIITVEQTVSKVQIQQQPGVYILYNRGSIDGGVYQRVVIK